MKANFELLARYNQWMNQQIYTAAAQLSREDFERDMGAFFGSVMGTLNHILVWDITWLQRFTAHPTSFESLKSVLKLKTPSAHNEIVHLSLKALKQARASMDDVLRRFAAEATEADYLTILSYRASDGEVFHRQFGLMVQHLFNHHTHHRGQVTTLFNQLGVDSGTTDLLMLIPQQTP